MQAKYDTKVYLFVVSSAFIFSTLEIALKLAGTSFDPFQITFLRFLIGGIFLLPFAVKEYRGQPKGFMTGRLWLFLLFLSAINAPVAMVVFQIGIMHSNAATASVIFCCNPIFTMLFAHLLTKDDKINKNKMIALAFGTAGLVFLIRPWDIQEGNTIAGALLCILASAIWSFYTVAGGKTIDRIGIFTQTTVTFLFGAIIILCVMLPLGRPILSGATENIGILLYTGIAVTCGGYFTYFMAIKYANASTASIMFFLKPVIAPVLAVIILGEAITYNMYIGIALTLAASYIMIFRKQGRSLHR